MINAKDAVVWTNSDTKEVLVKPNVWMREPQGAAWGDPIGTAYTQWNKMTDKQRVELMLETAIDLAMQGYPLKDVLTEFAQVRQFRALGEKSFPMCRAAP
jgi:hypothetical protein